VLNGEIGVGRSAGVVIGNPGVVIGVMVVA
jgi:hypothetical protein